MKKFIHAIAACALLATPFLSTASAQDEGEPDAGSVFAGLAPREIGPALTSGRVSDFAVYPDNPHKFLVATASGGLWRTENGGLSWSPIFDNYGSYSIGVVALDPTNPDIIWVGTGEDNSQRSVAFGDGVYKSIDGGKSFQNVGLENSNHIGMITFHPDDPDTVYVAAMGPLWSAGGDRGVYRTTDGGGTWERILHVDDDTGVNEVLVHPHNPDLMLASAYQRRRHVWTLINGGPGSGIQRSTDGGETWTEITSGLPAVEMGRIGIAFAPSDPDTVYAVIEAADDKGGFYKSTDFGASWERQSDYVAGSPQYYNELFVDPENPDRVYSMDTVLQMSEDGGKTWEGLSTLAKHVDDHALWINPENTAHLINGNDGGVYESFDRGETWRHMRNLPITQFYRATPDNDFPFYNIYGGTQDNSSIGAPARTFYTDGIANKDWIITMGGDGFKTQVDPENPNIVYSQLQYGFLVRFDKTTGERHFITPQPGADENDYKWNWNSPLIISPHDNHRLYYASEKIFRSNDQGRSWRAVSPDLSRGMDRNLLEVYGRVQSVDAVAKNDSTSMWGSIISLAESELQEGLIYAGTDDGLIQVTEDGGETWRQARQVRGMPDIIYVGDIAASQHDADRVYAVFDNHKQGDYAPYVYRSDDRGQSWESITGNLPERGPVHTIVEDHVNPDLLFVGTEFGVFYTQNGGEDWHPIKGGFPTISVRDLEIQERENDLVIGTFGRGFWVIDDYTPLRTAAADVAASEAHLFDVKDPWLYVEWNRNVYGPKGSWGDDYYTADNPPFGAVVSYHLRDGLKTLKAERQEVERELIEEQEDTPYPSWEALRAEDREDEPAIIITIRDADGNVVRRMTGPSGPGFHRVAWDLRHPNPDPVRLGGGGGGGFFGAAVGPLVAPGTYSASISRRVRGEWTDLAGPVEFEVTPLDRGIFQSDDLTALAETHRDLNATFRDMYSAGEALDALMDRAEHLKKGLMETPEATLAQKQRVREVETMLDDAEVLLAGDDTRSSRNEPAPASIQSRLGILRFLQWSTLADVSPNLMNSVEIARAELDQVIATLNTADGMLTEIESEVADVMPHTPGRIPVRN